MMRGAPAGGAVGSLETLPAPLLFRLLRSVLSPPEPLALPDGDTLGIPAPPLPTVGLLCVAPGWLGVLLVLPGPVPPGTPIPPLLIEPVLPVPLGIPPGAGPVGLDAPPVAELPPDALPPVPPELCAKASVEPAATNASVRAMEVFMGPVP